MRCLLEGEKSEVFVLDIPHGRLTLEVNRANPNFLFFLRENWKEFARKLKLKYGTCHMGEVGARERGVGLGANLDEVNVYFTRAKRMGILAKSGAREFRMVKKDQIETLKEFIAFLESTDL